MKKFKFISYLAAAFFAFTALVGCSDGTEKAVKKIQIIEKPLKMDYNVGDLFDPTGMKLRVLYGDNTTKDISQGYSWDIKDPLEEDDDEIMISYKSRNALLEINLIIEYPTKLEIKTNPTKTDYIIGDKFDPAGLVLLATFEDDQGVEYTKDITSGYRYSKTALKLGDISWKITYNRATCYVPITVGLPKASGISIATAPSTVTYTEGEFFDPTGMVVNCDYSDGSNRPIIDYAYSPMTALTTDVTKVTISYNEFTCTQNITVNPAPLMIAVTKNPDKTVYTEGEDFDPAGLEITKRVEGVPTVLSSADYTIVGGESLAVGSLVTVKLNENDSITTRLPITVTKVVDVKATDITKATGSTAGPATNATLKATALNEDYMSNFVKDDVITINFNSTAKGKAALKIASASTYVTEYSSKEKSVWYYPMKMGDVQANKLFEAYINDVKVDIPDSVIFEGSETENEAGDVLLLAKWKNVEMANIDLKLGVNTLKLKFLDQIYKNADVTIGSETKKGVLSSPVIDFITIDFDCLTATPHEHAYVNEIAEPEFLKEEATCQRGNIYYKSCECGLTSTETFEDNERGEHNYITKFQEGTHFKECSVCQDIVQLGDAHEYTYTASESDGVMKLVGTCQCGHSVTKTLNAATVGVAKSNGGYNGGDEMYFDLGASNIVGTNNISGITDNFAKTELNKKGDRGTGYLSNSGSATVQQALNKACGCDYVNYLYNGAGVQVKFTAAEAGQRIIVLKAASGYLTSTNPWTSGNMQLNKITTLKVNGNDVAIPDSYVLPGAKGGATNPYGTANANFVCLPFVIDVVEGENTILFQSFVSYAENGQVLYYDVSRTSGNTMSSMHVDSIAVF